jgi:beta-glucosidase
MTFRDTTLPLNDRVQALVKELTLEEKARQLVMGNAPVERLGIGGYHWWNEALHGFARSGLATVFPQAIGLAASWSPELLQAVGDVAAMEGHAKYNEELAARGGNTRIYKGLTIWSPNINIFRDPRWGRGQETYGEDPFLAGSLGAAFCRGLQGNHPRYLKAVATLKHFAVHSGPEELRHRFDAQASEQDLHDTYLPAFEEGVRFGGAKSVMSAYNGFNGTPCVASRRLLTEILRDDWGFDGAVVGDVDNVHDLYKEEGHHRTSSSAEAVAMAIRAGNDLRSGSDEEYASIVEAVARGFLTEADVDRTLTRLLALRFRLGHFDPPQDQPWHHVTPDIIKSRAHVDLAYEASKQSLVLLKNDGTLPLDPARIKTVAIIGPTADDMDVLIGNYAGDPFQPVTILQGLKQKLETRGVSVASETDLPFVAGQSRKNDPIPSGIFFADAAATVRGLTCRMYNGPTPEGAPVRERIESSPLIEWNAALPRPGELSAAEACVTWSGYIKLRHAGKYTFYPKLRGRVEIRIGDIEPIKAFFKLRIRQHTGAVELPGDSLLPITITWQQCSDEAFFALSWDPADGGASLEQAYARARSAAAQSDVVILTLGLSHKFEGEEMATSPEGFHRGDRTTIALPAPQLRLLDEIAALGKPVVVLLSSGSAVSFDTGKANAIMQTWYYGQQGGNAVADAMLGEFSPAGRLPVTFYRSDADLPAFEDYAMTGRTYRYFEGAPLFAFGHGLTYTTFQYRELSVTRVKGGWLARVQLENTGKRVSDEVVQIYASRVNPAGGYPIRWLAGYQRAKALAPGETRTVEIEVRDRWLALWSAKQRKRVVEPGQLTLSTGPASDNLSLRQTIECSG